MVYRGTIKGGAVVLPTDVTLPEGTELLVALPDQRAESAVRPVIHETLADFDRLAGTRSSTSPPVLAADPSQGADHRAAQAGPPEEPQGYPVADILSPTEYAWDENVYVAEEAVRAYLSGSHADH